MRIHSVDQQMTYLCEKWIGPVHKCVTYAAKYPLFRI